MTEERKQEIWESTIQDKTTDGWYPIGALEWTDDVPNYSEAGWEEWDWVWVKQEDRDQWSQEDNPEDRKIVGKNKLYWFSIGGNPVNGNTTYSLKPWGIIEILKYLVCSPAVPIGVLQGKRVMWRVPKGVRLKGMTEWITREEQ